MRWPKLFKRKYRRDTDWAYYEGYPPNLFMRRRHDDSWETRPATQEESENFLIQEGKFQILNIGPQTITPDLPEMDMQSQNKTAGIEIKHNRRRTFRRSDDKR